MHRDMEVPVVSVSHQAGKLTSIAQVSLLHMEMPPAPEQSKCLKKKGNNILKNPKNERGQHMTLDLT